MGREIIRQTVITVAASILAAYIVGQSPELRAWMRAQWAQP